MHVATFLGRRAILASLFRANSGFSLDGVRDCLPQESAFPCPVVIFVVLALETNLTWERLQLMATGLPSPRDSPPTLPCIIYTQSCTLLTAGKIKPGIFRNMYTHKHILYITSCRPCSYVSMLVEQSRLFALQVFLLCFVMRGYGSRLWSLAYTGALFVSSHKGPKLCGLEMQYYKLFFVFFFFALRVHSPSKGAVYNLMLCVQYGVWFCLCVSCPAVPFFFVCFVLLMLKQNCTF